MIEKARPDAVDVLDDLDARPGSATSLLRTIVGAVLRERGGWLPTRVIVVAMAALGVSESRARTALTRVKSKGLLVPESRGGRPGYRIAEAAVPMLERGDRRIHHPRIMDDQDQRWCLISFSIPETQRDARHQLRKRLSWIGAGTVTPALWITPDFLREEVAEIVGGLGLDERVTLFVTDEVHSRAAPREQLVSEWWDLDGIRGLHDAFLRQHRADLDALGPSPAPRDAFAIWIAALDTWRPIPYLDPGLPAALLPEDWPGRQSVPLFLRLRDAARGGASLYIEGLVGDGA